ncbi:two-component system activity regulator YycH [Halobacillus salinarum]|uniref:Two-component system activity regulator YycH n=1 Tax=Halobacillus salinarum TaxID=2932257 RepID=A0ABY4EJY9_9BACI|nr:two-component system activity regulator YycH [Halobacillus salinarum]UOQ44798.1 two-component system activity regulator YycH [Halobacillus salinarum]
MKVESLKTIILVILIVFSLLLTGAIWNYQPTEDKVQDDEGLIENTEISGTTQTMSSLLVPEKVVFSENSKYYSYKNKENVKELFNSLQNVTLLDISSTQTTGLPDADKMAEFIFPTSIPSDVIANIFKVDSTNSFISNIDFNRIFIIYPENAGEGASAQVWFVNQNNEKVLVATLPENGANAVIRDLDDHKQRLTEQFVYEPEGNNERMFLPVDEVKLPIKVLTYTVLETTPLRNSLFSRESVVINISGKDKQLRGNNKLLTMTDEKWMKYVDFNSSPIDNAPNMSKYDIMSTTLSYINDQKGWTDPFRLSNVSTNPQTIDFRMYNSGYPILASDRGISSMSLTYNKQNGNISEYVRPLIKFETYQYNESQQEALPSGQQVVDYITTDPKYSVSHIDDIQPGYSLVQQPSGSPVYNLLPYWFVHESGQWRQLDTKKIKAAVSQGAS